MKSIKSIKQHIASLLCLLAFVLIARAEERPNVILIISDDHAFDDYGFMGSEQVNTPMIDKLANEGLTYTRGYTMPVCSPALASLLTGKLPHEHGITGNDLAGWKAKGGRYGNQYRTELQQRLLDNPLI